MEYRTQAGAVAVVVYATLIAIGCGSHNVKNGSSGSRVADTNGSMACDARLVSVGVSDLGLDVAQSAVSNRQSFASFCPGATMSRKERWILQLPAGIDAKSDVAIFPVAIVHSAQEAEAVRNGDRSFTEIVEIDVDGIIWCSTAVLGQSSLRFGGKDSVIWTATRKDREICLVKKHETVSLNTRLSIPTNEAPRSTL